MNPYQSPAYVHVERLDTISKSLPWLARLHTMLCLVPVAHAAMVGVLILHAYLQFGHWPVCENPDPKELGNPLYPICMLGIPFLFTSLVMVIGTIPVWSFLPRNTRFAGWTSFHLGTFALWLVALRSGIGEWLLD